MKAFGKEFLRDPVDHDRPRQVFLGAFGKHPGWDDHMDDIGLETASLIAAKQLLYVEGIGGQIGAWEQLDGRAQIAFNHLFLWRRETQMLIGRLWISSDGKNRTRYPMVVCAHCTGVSLDVMLETMAAWLDELRTRVMDTTSARDVQEIVAQFRDGLREWLGEINESGGGQKIGSEEFLAAIGSSPEDETLLKALWTLRGSRFATGKFKAKAGLTAEQFRVLSSSAAPARTLHFWNRVFSWELDSSVPVLFLLPVEQYWLDVIAGEPLPADLFCLRASPRAQPLTSDGAPPFPVNFPEEARALIAQAAAGEHTGTGRTEPSWMGRLFSR